MQIVENEVKTTTLNWIESFVIDLNLCPFAKREVRADKLKLSVSTAENTKDLLANIRTEIHHLEDNPETETSLLIHPNVLGDFKSYNAFLETIDTCILLMGQRGIFQVASFHPQYQFAGTKVDDPENYTNRSPYPMLHFLREASVSLAVKQHPDSTGIPEKNIARLKSMGKNQLDELFQACFTSD